MEREGIEVVLVFAKYDLRAEAVDGELPVVTLSEVAPLDYPFFVKTGSWSQGGEILLSPYLRAKIDDEYKNVDIALKMSEKQSGSVAFVETKAQGYRYQKYADTEAGLTYFIPPRHWAKNRYRGFYQETIGGHYNTIGKDTIQIHFTDGREEFMNLVSKNMDEDKDFYKELVLDLVSMEQQLCIDEKSSMTMAMSWTENLLKQTERMVEKFCDAFDILEEDARPGLKPFYVKKSFHMIRKMSSKALIEHKIFHKDKVTAVSYREDFDTFEHRAIKTHLERLKSLVRIRRDMGILALKNEQKRLENNLDLSDVELKERMKYKNEDMGFYQEALTSRNLLADLDEKLGDEKELNKKWTELELKLNEVGRRPLMKAVKSVTTPAKTSNLFAFHPAYQRMYDLILADDEKMKGIDFYTEDIEDEFQVAKLSELYEKWVCLKLVQIFIQNYGFELQNHEGLSGIDGLIDYIHDVLNGGELSGVLFALTGKAEGKPMDVKIWYERKIKIDRKKLKADKIFAPRKNGKNPNAMYEKSSLTPDIIMKIETCGKVGVYVLDAKYKGNQLYDGMQELCEVAFQKYIWEMGHGVDMSQEFGLNRPPKDCIDGSFIIHGSTDTIAPAEISLDDKKVQVTYDPNSYLGAYPDELADRLWLPKCRENNWRVSESGFLDWVTWKSGNDNHENRLGIVAANPKMNNLPYLIRMIMEQTFGLYRARCWICGSDVNIAAKNTGRGNYKYHITCTNKECGKFTVETHCGNYRCPSHKKEIKIGKHVENYLGQWVGKDKKACWNVSCPKCRQLAPGSDSVEEDEELPFV